MLAPGTRLGPYEIVAPLGAGGMGEVWRAKDTRLGREVAIKVLPQHLSDQPEIRARFEREARTVSSLNHPNICALYDVGREGDTDYLVLELVEGDTLEARLVRGPLPAAEGLKLGAQIADALDRAHRAGVIHRDLKPGNVMLMRGGAKLMDFGLARATGLAGGSGSSAAMATLAQSPTMGRALTAEGTILGTFQYMAPEQLEGKEADARSDIWALGCVLYEMFTGRRAFEGRSQASLIAAILEREPAPVGETPSGASSAGAANAIAPPHGIERLIRNCLTKDPEERIQTAHDVKLQLQGIAESAGLSTSGMPVSVAGVRTPATSTRDPRVARPVVLGLAGALVLALAGLAWFATRPTPPAQTLRFTIQPPPGTRVAYWPQLSPDGKYLLFQADDSTTTPGVWIRSLDQVDAVRVAGTGAVQRAYWAPDSRELAFFDGDVLKRVAIAGGSPITVQTVPGAADLSWGSKGHILFDGQATDSLRVLPAAGGELRPASRIDRAGGEVGCAWPHFLPDGERFLFIGHTSTGGGTIRLGKLGTLDSKVLGRSDGRVEYAPGGWVLFVRGTALLAQKLDERAGKLVGDPVHVADDIRLGSSQGHFTVSKIGGLAFSPNPGTIGRATHEIGTDGSPVLEPTLAAGGVRPRMSPDGSRIAYIRLPSTSGFLGEAYVYDLGRKTDTRVTFTENQVRQVAWAPDGRRLAAQVLTGEQEWSLRVVSADGMGVQDSIPSPERGAVHLWGWSGADSAFVLFTETGRTLLVPVDGARAPREVLTPPNGGVHPAVSPDGRWLAYAWGAYPQVHIFVQSLRGEPGRWQISAQPGVMPVWTKGGREIVFESSTRQALYAVDVETDGVFRAGSTRELRKIPASSGGIGGIGWVVGPDGARVWAQVPPPATQSASIIYLSNFASLLPRK